MFTKTFTIERHIEELRAELHGTADVEEARTIVVNTIVVFEIFYLFNCRSLTGSFWKLGLFSNLWVWGGIAAMLVLQLLLTYWPPLSSLFQTAPIAWRAWAEITVFAALCSLLIGLEKRWTMHQRST